MELKFLEKKGVLSLSILILTPATNVNCPPILRGGYPPYELRVAPLKLFKVGVLELSSRIPSQVKSKS